MEAMVIINLKDGHLEVSGTEAFVRSIYTDFKSQISQQKTFAPLGTDNTPTKSEAKTSRGQTKATSSSKSRSKKASADVDINPELNVTGVKEFYEKYAPKNDPERALIFAIFLRDEKNISPCSVSDLHTCFFTLKGQLKVPSNYNGLLANDAVRTKFFNRQSMEDISVTTIGENYFHHSLKRRQET